MHSGDTHPGDASLADPLFACGGKEGKKNIEFSSDPLYRVAKERVKQRSAFRVSK